MDSMVFSSVGVACAVALVILVGLVTIMAGGMAMAQPAHPGDGAAENENENADREEATIYDLTIDSLDGEAVDLGRYRGKVVLVVNVASRCGFTSQYAGLQALHAEFSARGFSVLAFPSNDFGGQEPGSAAEIKAFCQSRYNVTFPMFAKCGVRTGAEQSPVYRVLSRSGHVPNWNFCKYLVGKDGRVIAFYSSRTAPDSAALKTAITDALAAPMPQGNNATGDGR